jgi:hypothetical protein
MRTTAAIVAVLCLHAGAAQAQDDYAAVLLKYLSGNADEAVETLRRLSIGEIQPGIDAFETTRNRQILPAAAALHTEIAIRRDGGFASLYHLQVATAIVEFGERRVGRSNATMALAPRYAAPVPEEFRRLWYCAVITGLEGAGMLAMADKYLTHARGLYPDNAEIRLLAGVAEEMRASPRTATVSEGDRRKALAAAEKHYRAVIAAEPARLEARLRLGRVLSERGEWTEARALLVPLLDTPEGRIAYLSALFLGEVEDGLQHTDAAYAFYQRAAGGLPMAQVARLAASELRHRAGDRVAAAEALPAAVGAKNEFDPWWTYVFGEYWRTDLLLSALRRLKAGP